MRWPGYLDDFGAYHMMYINKERTKHYAVCTAQEREKYIVMARKLNVVRINKNRPKSMEIFMAFAQLALLFLYYFQWCKRK